MLTTVPPIKEQGILQVSGVLQKSNVFPKAGSGNQLRGGSGYANLSLEGCWEGASMT